jgi:hypothetical protein
MSENRVLKMTIGHAWVMSEIGFRPVQKARECCAQERRNEQCAGGDAYGEKVRRASELTDRFQHIRIDPGVRIASKLWGDG